MKGFINTTIKKTWQRLLWINNSILQVKIIKNNSQQFSLFTQISSSCKWVNTYSKSLLFSHKNDVHQWQPRKKNTELGNLLIDNYY